MALGGRKEAFAELVSRHWGMAVAMSARLLGPGDLARDAVQEASIAAMTGLDRLRSPERFGAWFCGIALNVARQWRRQLHAEVPAALAGHASPMPDPAECAEAAELASAVRAAVAALADGQREAVMLFYLQGLTHREVAAELAISPGAVKARLHQARRALLPALTPLISDPKEQSMTQPDGPAWIEVDVTEVRRGGGDNPARPVHVMVLAERGGARRLPIWIGPAEATAMALSLESQEMPRPLTYQLAGRMLEAAGSRVTEARITRLTGEIFYAAIVIDGPAGLREVDARPSDAVNLALVAAAPLRVDGALFADHEQSESHRNWQDYPAATAEIAAEAQQELRRR